MRKKLTLVAGVFVAGVLLLANNAFSKECFYFNDFEGTIGLKWSDTNIDATPSGRKFLGQFANDSVTLNLIDLPAHLSVSVSFDLYLIESTEKSEEHFFELSIDGGPVLMTTSFNHILPPLSHIPITIPVEIIRVKPARQKLILLVTFLTATWFIAFRISIAASHSLILIALL